MELVSLYLESRPSRSQYRSEGGYRIWDGFINSTERAIAVVAGRRTGKTTAILKRAILNDKDTYVVSPINAMMNCMGNMFVEIANELGVEFETLSNRPGAIEIYVNDKTVYLYTARSFNRFANFNNLHGKEIIFDEPEHLERVTESFMRSELQYILNSASVVMVGTIKDSYPTPFKRLYRMCKDEGLGYHKRITTFDVGLEVEELHRLQSTMSPDTFRREIMCEWEERRDPYALRSAI